MGEDVWGTNFSKGTSQAWGMMYEWLILARGRRTYNFSQYRGTVIGERAL